MLSAIQNYFTFRIFAIRYTEVLHNKISTFIVIRNTYENQGTGNRRCLVILPHLLITTPSPIGHETAF